MLWLSRLECLTSHCSFHRTLVSLCEELGFLLFGHFSDVTRNITGINLLSSQLSCEFWVILQFPFCLWENKHKLSESTFCCLLYFLRHWELSPGICIFTHRQQHSSSLLHIHSIATADYPPVSDPWKTRKVKWVTNHSHATWSENTV